MIQYVLIATPQSLLLLYIIRIREGRNLARFGLTHFGISDLLYSLLLFAILFLSFSSLAVFLSLAPGYIRKLFEAGYRWRLPGLTSLPLVMLFCLVTGFREELFFRAYLLIRFKELGLVFPIAAASSTILFAIGHSYQGMGGIVFALLHGLIFAYAFTRRRNLGMLALAHALYNFTLLILSTF
jgi:membrane protease YdiL (CAAX protease family)